MSSTPNIHVSAKVAQVVGEQAQHTLNKGLDSAYYRELVLQHLRNFTARKREELEAWRTLAAGASKIGWLGVISRWLTFFLSY